MVEADNNVPTYSVFFIWECQTRSCTIKKCFLSSPGQFLTRQVETEKGTKVFFSGKKRKRLLSPFQEGGEWKGVSAGVPTMMPALSLADKEGGEFGGCEEKEEEEEGGEKRRRRKGGKSGD